MKKLAIGLSALALFASGFITANTTRKYFVYTGSGVIMFSGNAIGTFSGLTPVQGFTTTATGRRLVQLIRTNGISGQGVVLGTLATSIGMFSHRVYR